MKQLKKIMRHAKSKCDGMGLGILGISNNPEASVMGRNNASKKSILDKMIAMACLETTEKEKEHHDLQSSEIHQSKKNVKLVKEAFENLLNPFDAENKEGIYCIISSGLCVTLDIQKDLLKPEIYCKKIKDKFIKEHLEPCKIFLTQSKDQG